VNIFAAVAQPFAGAGSTLSSKHSFEIVLPCNVERMHTSEAASRSITNITTLDVSEHTEPNGQVIVNNFFSTR
jgi:hypothetical protein